MGRSCVTIGAAMLAAFIGINGYLEWYIGRAVMRQDGFTAVDMDFRCRPAFVIFRFREPVVIEGFAVACEKTRSRIAGNTPALYGILVTIVFDSFTHCGIVVDNV